MKLTIEISDDRFEFYKWSISASTEQEVIEYIQDILSDEYEQTGMDEDWEREKEERALKLQEDLDTICNGPQNEHSYPNSKSTNEYNKLTGGQ